MRNLFILLCFASSALTKDYYFYADVRWDNVEQFRKAPETIPFDHGLRIVPALYVALDKLQGLRLYSASMFMYKQYSRYYYYTNYFYQSSTYGKSRNKCMDVDGTNINSGTVDCVAWAHYDIEWCSKMLLKPRDVGDTDYHCKNYPGKLPSKQHIVQFKDSYDSDSMTILGVNDTITIILPDGTGLPSAAFTEFNEKFGSISPNPLFGDLNKRIRFIANELGSNFSGIIGSSNQAYYTALISQDLKIPNIAATISDKTGAWPISSRENFADRSLDTTLVLGYEDWMVLDLLAYIIQETQWEDGTMQIVTETGYSERIANSIKQNLGAELRKRYNNNPRISKDMFIDKLTRWDYYVPVKERDNDLDVDDLVLKIKGSTRVILLSGKIKFLREMVQRFDETPKKYGIILIPENGAPCDNIWDSKNETNAAVKKALEGVFMICHNSHNRNEWTFRNTNNMSQSESFNKNWHPDIYQFYVDPPSFNIWRKKAPKDAFDQLDYNQLWPTRKENVNMSRWNTFADDFRAKCNQTGEGKIPGNFTFTFPSDQQVSGVAGFAHDTVVWGMFAALFNYTNPKIFEDINGHYTLMSLFADGTAHPRTTMETQAYQKMIGWPGMWGYDSNSSAYFNETHNQQDSKKNVLVNDGPWSDFLNRYTFKDNRIYGGVPHTIKMFVDNGWIRYASMMNHRREFERDKLMYETDASLLGIWDDYLSNKKSQVQNTMYEKFKFYKITEEHHKFIDAKEPECKYDGKPCKLRALLQWVIPVSIIVLLLIIIVLVILTLWKIKKHRWEAEVGAMKWKLLKEVIDFEVSGLGLRSSMMGTMGGTVGTRGTMGGTMGTMGTMGLGTRGTRGGDTVLTRGGTMGGTFYSMATFQTLGTNAMSDFQASGAGKKDQVYTKLSIYRAKRWAVKNMSGRGDALIMKEEKDFLEEMQERMDMNHENIASFAGICQFPGFETPTVYLTEYCTNGSLQDVLEDESVTRTLDTTFKLSFIVDIINGMDYIHSKAHVESHGYLKSSNCLVTKLFTIKLADFGLLHRTCDRERVGEMGSVAKKIRSLWTAPEILRNKEFVNPKGSKAGDVYSFGIICHEILETAGPFNTHDDSHALESEEVIKQVVKSKFKKPFRPVFAMRSDQREIAAQEMAKQCWDEDPDKRPTFKHLQNKEIPNLKDEGLTLIQTVLRKIQTFIKSTEKQIREHGNRIKSESRLYKGMQSTRMPKHVIDKLTIGETVSADELKLASVLCFEVQGMNDLVDQYIKRESHATEAWKILSNIDHAIFSFTENHTDLYIVNCSHGCYVLLANGTGGCPTTQSSQLLELVTVIKAYISTLEFPYGVPNTTLSVRAAIDSGPMYGGVVGDKFQRYQIYGDPYEIAENMRSSAGLGETLVTGQAKELMGDQVGVEFMKIDKILANALPNGDYFSAKIAGPLLQ